VGNGDKISLCLSGSDIVLIIIVVADGIEFSLGIGVIVIVAREWTVSDRTG
jgi:hypothetical protein